MIEVPLYDTLLRLKCLDLRRVSQTGIEMPRTGKAAYAPPAADCSTLHRPRGLGIEDEDPYIFLQKGRWYWHGRFKIIIELDVEPFVTALNLRTPTLQKSAVIPKESERELIHRVKIGL